MKLKIRADAKDWAIFIVFCFLLLYLSAVAVLNLSEFSKFGTFSGLNPLPAFSGEYILPTLVIFIFAMAAIIMSVSSYFFEFDKGIGISATAKKEKGYSRWCTEREMKKTLKMVEANAATSQYAGIPILNNGKKIYVDAGEYHNLIIGSTGSGKTEMLIQPMVKLLAKKGESMIITDPKGEIYEKNALELKEKGYNIVLLNFRNPQNGNCWNPFTLPYNLYTQGNQDKACELLEDLALNILYDENAKSQDPFWEKTSADYFTGLALGLFEDAKAEEINLNSINLMTTAGEDKMGGNTTYMKEYFSYKDQGSPAYINVASTIMAPSETKSSILSVFKQKIKLFSSRENLSEMLSHSDFNMEDIGRKKTAVFIVIQDEKKTYHSLVTIFLKQCYETLIRVAQENGGKLAYKTNFMLDEFANMPPLKDVTTMVTAARSRAIRFTFVIQNFAQLYEVYGKENGETIKGNCGNILYLISSELSALEEISKLCGEEKSKEKDKTDSRPLATVSDLQRLPQWTMIAIRIRMMPFKTIMEPNWKMVKNNAWGKNYPLASYPIREKGVVQTFDIKAFVDKKKEEKFANMFNNIAGGNSKPGPVDFNPFASPNSDKKSGGFDVDEMVKRIDAKIAELEAEEKAQQEAEKVALAEAKKTEEKETKVKDSERKIEDKKEEVKPLFDFIVPVKEEKEQVEEVKDNPLIDTIKPQEEVKVAPVVEEAPTEVPVEEPLVEKEEVEVEEPVLEDIVIPSKKNDSKKENVEIQKEEVVEETIPVVEESTPVSEELQLDLFEELEEETDDAEDASNNVVEEIFDYDKVVDEIPQNIFESIPTIDVSEVVDDIKEVEQFVEPIEDVVEIQTTSVEDSKVINNYVTDDQFFDDFFADDEE